MTGWQMPYVHHEFPKWIDGPAGPVIIQIFAEERGMRMAIGRDIGRVKANRFNGSRAEAPAAELGAEIVRLRAGGRSLRGIAEALNRRGVRSARGRGWGPAQISRLIRQTQNPLQPVRRRWRHLQNSVR